MLRALLVASVLLCRPAWADPALWAVHGRHATVYLLGSVHALPRGLAWEGRAIRRAVAASQAFWFEIDLSTPDWMGALGVVLLKGVDFRHRLGDELSPAAAARLAELAGDQLWWVGHLRPWMALELMEGWLVSDDLGPGVEDRLQAEAEAAGKPIHGIETAASQVDLMADTSDREALADLEELLTAPADRTRRTLDPLVRRWQSGRLIGLDGQGRATPLSKRIIDDRNVTFADAVARLSRGGQTVMVVVGAAHMPGPRGVVAILRRRGLRVDRVG